MSENIKGQDLVTKLYENRDLTDEEFKTLLETDEYDEALFKKAVQVRKEHYGDKVFLRGLIEYTNYCRNNCNYCGIRKSNQILERYRLSK